MQRLNESDMNVTQLSKALGQDQSMISHNLKKLVRCGFAYSRRDGKSIIYSLNKDTSTAIFKVIKNHAEKHCPYRGKCPNSFVRTDRRTKNVLQSM